MRFKDFQAHLAEEDKGSGYAIHPATDEDKKYSKTTTHVVRFDGDHKWPEGVEAYGHGKHGGLIGHIKTDRHGKYNGVVAYGRTSSWNIHDVAKKMHKASTGVVKVSDLKPRPRSE